MVFLELMIKFSQKTNAFWLILLLEYNYKFDINMHFIYYFVYIYCKPKFNFSINLFIDSYIVNIFEIGRVCKVLFICNSFCFYNNIGSNNKFRRYLRTRLFNIIDPINSNLFSNFSLKIEEILGSEKFWNIIETCKNISRNFGNCYYGKKSGL